jgi:hypothetical protein
MSRRSTPNPEAEPLLQEEDHISKLRHPHEYLASPEIQKSPASSALTVEPEEPKLEYGGNKIILGLVAELQESEKGLSSAEARLAEAEDTLLYWQGVESKCSQREQNEGYQFAASRRGNAETSRNRAIYSVAQHQDSVTALQTILMQFKEEQESKSVND